MFYLGISCWLDRTKTWLQISLICVGMALSRNYASTSQLQLTVCSSLLFKNKNKKSASYCGWVCLRREAAELHSGQRGTEEAAWKGSTTRLSRHSGFRRWAGNSLSSRIVAVGTNTQFCLCSMHPTAQNTRKPVRRKNASFDRDSCSAPRRPGFGDAPECQRATHPTVIRVSKSDQ